VLIKSAVEGEPIYLDVTAPPARYLQYRLTLKSDGKHSPSVGRVALKFLTPNMQPRITSIKATYSEEKPGRGEDAANAPPAQQTKLNIEWEAGDPNNDKMAFTLEVRRLGDGSPFIPIAKDITAGNYEWDTRAIPDGRYILRLTASDAPDNVPGQVRTATRLSAEVVVDNTAPLLADLTINPLAKTPGSVQVSAKVGDAVSSIAQVRYSVDGAAEWQPILPVDMIYDSTSEAVSFIIPDLSPGAHVVAIRVTDALGNSQYASRAVEVTKK
jgi:hypothetical protein